MEPKRTEIDVALLTVDVENFRIGEFENTREAYKAMIVEEGEGLANLAEDIIELGLSPAELFIVTPDPENPKHYIVCEGNRRLTSLRLLETPALAADTPVHKRFLDLSKKYKAKPIKKVYCVVMESKDAAFQWIERKHLDLGGRGVAKWGAAATSRANAFRGKIRASKAVIDHLKKAGVLPKSTEDAVARRTTNLDRVLQMPYMNSALGVKIDKTGEVTFGNGDQAAGNKLLLKIVKKMAAKEFTVNEIRSADERKDFIDQFASGAVHGTETGGGSGKSKANASAATKSSRRSVPSPNDRDTLALKGRDYILEVHEPRLNSLYQEARQLKPDALPNSAAILTRVFLELSTDHYLTKKRVPLPADQIAKGKKHWSEMGISLREKIKAVLSKVDPTGKDPALKGARQGLSTNDALHSIDALHGFIHHLVSDPAAKEIKQIWLRWHPYLAALFDDLRPNKP